MSIPKEIQERIVAYGRATQDYCHAMYRGAYPGEAGVRETSAHQLLIAAIETALVGAEARAKVVYLPAGTFNIQPQLDRMREEMHRQHAENQAMYIQILKDRIKFLDRELAKTERDLSG